jgi:hypothetical protein
VEIGPDPEENVVQAASSLHAFAGLNASSVLEVTNTLSTTQNKITELEEELKTVKDKLTVEFEEATRVVATLNTENLNTALQMQKDEMNAEYERRAQTQWDTHVRELECVKLKFGDEIETTKKGTHWRSFQDANKLTQSKGLMEQQSFQILGLVQEKKKLEKSLEERKTSILVVETVKAKALELNEKLKSEQKEFLCLLSDMQDDRSDQLRLQDKITEIQGQYQEANDAFDQILKWKELYETPPPPPPMYTH